jgi:acetylcholinesterase/cholinesterase
MSVTLHLLSADSAGLFQKAIIQSNPAAILYRTPQENLEYAERFAKNVQCAVNDTACLRRVPLDKLIDEEIFPEIIVKIPLGSKMILPWQPVVDGQVIPQQPLDMFRQGKFQRVPIMLGNVKNETGMRTPMTKGIYEAFMDSIFAANTSKVLNMYPPIGLESGNQAFRVLTDYLFVCPVRYLAGLITKQNVPAYLYEFVHGPKKDVISPNTPCNHQNMACHSAELPFVFNTEPYYNATFPADEQRLSWSMNSYWSSFASGKWGQDGSIVSRFGSPETDPAWPVYDPASKQYIAFDVPETYIGSKFRDDLCAFWDEYGYYI